MTENLLPGIELVNGDCAAVLPELPPADLILTSPPYDDLREYGGYNGAFDFDAIAAACVANLAPGGVLVWVVADQIVDGGESGTSFRQALGFKALGLTLHQTLFFEAAHYRPIDQSRALRGVQYMFVFAKGKPIVANIPIDRPNVTAGAATRCYGSGRMQDDAKPDTRARVKVRADFGRRGPIWRYATGGDDFGHPAVFPYALARDHILSWTNPGDLVIDPMVGSGTMLRAAADLRRRAIGIEINPEYCDLIRQRLTQFVLLVGG